MRFLAVAFMLLFSPVAGAQVAADENGEATVGRFQFVPASGEMPAVVFDTVTGCIELIEKFVLDDGSNQTVWIRRISDEVIAGTPKRCEKTEDSIP
ncbi:hypothetical protein [Stakelama tenebrarum]|uniref:Uncharacterized protein n=1 Tax=Stakelama tenebrarum TaxID=2711215 RepID=A0A6G6Y6G2_9SPHN|nr:hypothetical protein [Sphingosinithalassobacter tenebrarum]QIG80505.1 hypothetical protein G5C33_12420 [Sphingosinithalassobacter tenebrarum]